MTACKSDLSRQERRVEMYCTFLAADPEYAELLVLSHTGCRNELGGTIKQLVCSSVYMINYPELLARRSKPVPTLTSWCEIHSSVLETGCGCRAFR